MAGGPGCELNGDALVEQGHALDERRERDVLRVRRRQLGKDAIRLHETVQRVGAAFDHAEAAAKIADGIVVALDAIGTGEQAAGDGLDGSKRVGELVAQDANEALPRGLFFFAQRLADVGEEEQGVGRAVLTEGGFAQEPAIGLGAEGVDALIGRSEQVFEAKIARRAAEGIVQWGMPSSWTPASFTSWSTFSRSKA